MSSSDEEADMAIAHKVHSNGTVIVPARLLKAAGFKPGMGVFIQVAPSSLIIEQGRRHRTPRPLQSLRQLRGRFQHIDWDTVRHDLRARWSAWRGQRSA
jgi:antitoxin component of MazEF toxin-antitoxin module